MGNGEGELKAQGSKLKESDSEELSAFSFQPSARAKRVPIIAMTAHAMAGDEDKSLEAGMNGHVTKPIDPDQLFAALQKWILPPDKRAADRQQDVTAEPSAPAPSKLSEDDLPESLAGFDLEAGLRRLMGNKRLYRKLLLDFGSKYTGTAGEIHHALDAGDFEKAHSLVHNLKGLAGNLAATELQAATVELEKLIKGGQKKISPPEQLDQKFVELEKAIFSALQAVQILGSPAEEKTAVPSTSKLSAVPPELIKELVSRIQEAAEMGDFKQISSIAGELKSRSKAMIPICDRLIQLAEDFDFDRILKMVAELEYRNSETLLFLNPGCEKDRL
jgi:HPt (histidine-containing phosphotransfer) domain-containing protein